MTNDRFSHLTLVNNETKNVISDVVTNTSDTVYLENKSLRIDEDLMCACEAQAKLKKQNDQMNVQNNFLAENFPRISASQAVNTF